MLATTLEILKAMDVSEVSLIWLHSKMPLVHFRHFTYKLWSSPMLKDECNYCSIGQKEHFFPLMSIQWSHIQAVVETVSTSCASSFLAGNIVAKTICVWKHPAMTPVQYSPLIYHFFSSSYRDWPFFSKLIKSYLICGRCLAFSLVLFTIWAQE